MDTDIKPVVSVIMPAYNAQKFISQSIESVLSQSYQKWELIIIDDGSIDDTAGIVKEYSKKDGRIKYCYQRNTKQGLARNTGILNSRAELIAFLDADDIWLPQKLEIMLAEFSSGDQHLLFSNAFISEGASDGPATANINQTFMVQDKEYFGEEGLKDFLDYNKIPMLTVLAKKECLVQVGMFSNRSIAEDYELWLKLLINGYKFRSVSRVLCIYRVHYDSSSNHNRAAIDDSISIISNLKKATQQYNTLFKIYLKKWYKRKIGATDQRKDFVQALRNMRKENIANFKLMLINLININNPVFFRISKSLAYRFL